MNSRERISAILSGREPDQIGYEDADVFEETIGRWHGEGLPSNLSTSMKECWMDVRCLRYFGSDIYVTWPDYSLKFDVIDYDVGGDWRIVNDEFGATKKVWTEKSGAPQFMDPVVKSPKDFTDIVEPILVADDVRRVSGLRYPFKQQLAQMITRFQREFFVLVGVEGPLGIAMYLCGGLARTLVFIMKNQDFVPHMFNSIADFVSDISESYIEAGVDGIWVFDDLGSRDGPFLSPSLFERLIQPGHRRLCAPFLKKGLPRLLHTDGNIEPLMPQILDAGFVGIQPLQTGVMDIKRIKEQYGDRVTLMGGIDTRVLSSGSPAEIEREVTTKIALAGRGGRYIATSDGPVPPSVSLENYRLFRRLLNEYGRYPL